MDAILDWENSVEMKIAYDVDAMKYKKKYRKIRIESEYAKRPPLLIKVMIMAMLRNNQKWLKYQEVQRTSFLRDIMHIASRIFVSFSCTDTEITLAIGYTRAMMRSNANRAPNCVKNPRADTAGFGNLTVPGTLSITFSPGSHLPAFKQVVVAM